MNPLVEPTVYYSVLLTKAGGSMADRAQGQQGSEGRRGTLEGRALGKQGTWSAGQLGGRALGEEGHLEGRALGRQGT